MWPLLDAWSPNVHTGPASAVWAAELLLRGVQRNAALCLAAGLQRSCCTGALWSAQQGHQPTLCLTVQGLHLLCMRLKSALQAICLNDADPSSACRATALAVPALQSAEQSCSKEANTHLPLQGLRSLCVWRVRCRAQTNKSGRIVSPFAGASLDMRASKGRTAALAGPMPPGVPQGLQSLSVCLELALQADRLFNSTQCTCRACARCASACRARCRTRPVSGRWRSCPAAAAAA